MNLKRLHVFVAWGAGRKVAPTGVYVNPDSVLARTAREMLEAHAGGAGPSAAMVRCPVCGEELPCAVGRSAAEVLFAAGLAEQSGLVAATRQGRGPESRPTSVATAFASYPGRGLDTPVVGMQAEGPFARRPVDLAFAKPARVPPPDFGYAPSIDEEPSSFGYDPPVSHIAPESSVPGGLVAAESPAPSGQTVRPGPAPSTVEEGGAPAVARPTPGEPSGPAPTPGGGDPAGPVSAAPGIWNTAGAPSPVRSEPAAPKQLSEAELLALPPSYRQQNRPFDAPQFTSSTRPTVPAGQPGPGPKPSDTPVGLALSNARSEQPAAPVQTAPTHQPGGFSRVPSTMPSGLGNVRPPGEADAGLDDPAQPTPAHHHLGPKPSGLGGRPEAAAPPPEQPEPVRSGLAGSSATPSGLSAAPDRPVPGPAAPAGRDPGPAGADPAGGPGKFVGLGLATQDATPSGLGHRPAPSAPEPPPAGRPDDSESPPPPAKPARVKRPPLEAPQMGQLNKPLTPADPPPQP